MRLVTYIANNSNADPRIGAFNADGAIIDLPAAEPAIPNDMLAFIEMGDDGLALARAAMDSGGATPIAADNVKLLAPLPKPPRNLMCVGKNYFDHASEFHNSGFDSTATDSPVPEFPIIFTKAPTSVAGPYDDINASLDPTNTTDYEGELAVVIGKGGLGISKENAMDHVYGYSVMNDVTARDLQVRHRQWFLGKSVDTYCPMGPCLVTADELPDIETKQLTTSVNGEPRQKTLISGLIFDIPTLIETISRTVTMESGDIIGTGTPLGVGIGFDPKKFLVPGDEVTVAIEGIGQIVNRVA
jgi:2-keto-4-pentenoate hydratase/2-oxohepta-3-ene-1,7-dioic acid hydratase in catechol pathway